MFTGIIEAVGTLLAMESRGGDARLRLDTGQLNMSDVKLGDSIAISGVCLTAVEINKNIFVADVSGETMAHTTLGDLVKGDRVNIEKALTLSSRLGGHMVSGHVDAVGEIVSRVEDARSIQLQVSVPGELIRYIAKKGSICVDGISLTVNAVDDESFNLNIIPHTLEHTTMSDYASGRQVNLEVDIIARYLEQLLSGEQAPSPAGVTAELLQRFGFVK